MVYERSSAALQARGAGIAVLDETVRWLAERTPTNPDELCSSTSWIRFLGADGSPVHQRAHRYRYSSWNTIYRALLASSPRALPARPRGDLVRQAADSRPGWTLRSGERS